MPRVNVTAVRFDPDALSERIEGRQPSEVVYQLHTDPGWTRKAAEADADNFCKVAEAHPDALLIWYLPEASPDPAIVLRMPQVREYIGHFGRALHQRDPEMRVVGRIPQFLQIITLIAAGILPAHMAVLVNSEPPTRH
jgi:hypothetical protein